MKIFSRRLFARVLQTGSKWSMRYTLKIAPSQPYSALTILHLEKLKQKCFVRLRYTSVLQTDPKRGMRCTFKIVTGRLYSVFIILFLEN